MRILTQLLILLILIALNGLFAMGEMALVSARRARLAVFERQRRPGASRARWLAEDPQRFLPTVQVGVTLVSILLGVFGGDRLSAPMRAALLRARFPAAAAAPVALAIVVLGVTFVTLVLGELVPKQLALRRAERLAAALAGPIYWTARLTAPAVFALNRASGLVLRLLGQARLAPETVTEEELRALLAEGAAAGVLDAEERDMIERVLRLADKPVRALMTPRTELAWIDRTDSPREIVATLKASPHSRFVVCDGAVDNVVGVVQAKDLLDRLLGGGELSVAASLRAPMMVPDTVSALDALERLRADPLGMALVLDEYGNFEGVVTAADLLEAIVGDPTDTAPMASDPAAPAELAMDGGMPVDEAKARLDLPDLPGEGTYHTLGGLILALLRRVPRLGDRIVFGGWRFEVTAMEGRRVTRLSARREEAGGAIPQR